MMLTTSTLTLTLDPLTELALTDEEFADQFGMPLAEASTVVDARANHTDALLAVRSTVTRMGVRVLAAGVEEE